MYFFGVLGCLNGGLSDFSFFYGMIVNDLSFFYIVNVIKFGKDWIGMEI